MVARVRTVAFHGVEVIEVETQVTIASGLPAFTVVGLPDKAVAESRERVRAALGALGLALPSRRITVNLAPADVLKEGSHFDLPIALALLAAMDVLPADELGLYTVLGELSLDGSLTSVACGTGGGKPRQRRHLSRRVRRRSRLGRRDRGHCRADPVVDRQPFQGYPAPAPTRAASCRRTPGGPRPSGCQGPGKRQTRA